jgi:hypothetical protein
MTQRLRAARLNCTAVTAIDPAAGETKDGGDSGAIQPLQRMQAIAYVISTLTLLSA